MDFELTEEQRMLKETVARFVDRDVIPLAPEIDEQERFPEENFKAMAEMGLFGITIPEEYGGSGSDFLSCCRWLWKNWRGAVFPRPIPMGPMPSCVRKTSSGTAMKNSGENIFRT